MIRYFISNIQDIDDMLGPEPGPLSPRKSSDCTVTTDNSADCNNVSSLSSDSTVEEVPLAVVKVHESGAQRAEVCC